MAYANGLRLCAQHYKLLAKGTLGVDDGHRILSSQRFAGHCPAFREHATALAA
ncbi:hypothetical protein ACFU3E_09735 [Streptomyces sp. NPDC057424]|uniref:hypothetical protein n=1 Tax=Streptomyces sp. NPDC057424 TaxID=3346127 RepID=UPI0036922030